jgi:hypothetical protein
MRNNGSMPLILPDVSKRFRGNAQGIDHLLLCMGLFSIFWLVARAAWALRLSFPLMIAGWLAEP